MRLPKNIIKKYGISKKAWNVFKGLKQPIKSIKKTKRSKPMARRKNTFRRASKGIKQSEILGAVIYGAIGEQLLDKGLSMVNMNNQGIQANAVKGVIGYFIAKNTSGFLKGVGDSAVSISAYKVGKEGLGSISNLLGTNTNNATSTNDDYTLG